MTIKTSLDSPVWREDTTTQKGLTDIKNPVIRSGSQSHALSDFASTFIKSKIYESFDNILNQSEFRKILTMVNIFVFGKVGFFDIILEGLKNAFLKENPNTKFKIIRTLSDLGNDTRRSSSKSTTEQTKKINKSPVILIPTAKSRVDFNEIVSAAFESKNVIWLIALPSQLEKHLLVSFDCFFLPNAPKEEIGLLSGITPLDQVDIDEVSKSNGAQAILTTARYMPNLSVVDKEFGTVIYINQLNKSKFL